MIQIITDSAADFDPRELKALKINCIPLTVIFGDTEYQENVELSKDRFYDLLLGSEEAPKTAQASPQVLEELFRGAHGCGGAVYICISSALSGTYQTAMMTQRMLEYEDCHVVDSLNATGGQRMLVEHAVRLLDQGKSLEEIVAGVEELRSRIALYACINSLEYLYRGGRISQTTYRLGTMANIKPIIEIQSDGRVGIPGKAMGMRMGMEQLCKKPEQRPRDGEYPLYVMYTNNRDVARNLAERLKKAGLEIGEDRIIQVGAAIGSHIGPEACGLVYVQK